MLEPLLTRKGLRTSRNPIDVPGAICHPMTLLRRSNKFNNVEMPRVCFSDLGLPVAAKFVCKMVKIATWERYHCYALTLLSSLASWHFIDCSTQYATRSQPPGYKEMWRLWSFSKHKDLNAGILKRKAVAV